MTDIETLLRNSSRQTLDLPATEILRRGDRIRRRRRGSKVVATVAAVALGGIGAYVTIPDRLIDSDIATPEPPARNTPVDWSGNPTNLTPEELDVLSDRCLMTAWADVKSLYADAPDANNAINPDEVEQIPEGTRPFLAEKRGSTAMAIFDGRDYEVTCSTVLDASPSADSEPDLAGAFGLPQVWGAFAATGPWEDFYRGGVGEGTQFRLPLPKEMDVAKVVFISSGEEIPATIVNGVAVAWIDHQVDVESADFRAYDADGNLVHPEPGETKRARPKTEWTETADGIRVTRSLGNEKVESAWFWVGEQRFDATITEDNVAVALIPTGKLTTDQLNKLQIQGRSPEGLYLRGCTGEPCGP
ncbi:hypothetical protein SAMN05428985_105392 [Nocardioides sp. YR527]|uniref:hypothetical protein n=1 Tax=Nocardioides sp. YR527 TaxID=1881028 RepID=UPI0008849821|nr:hypothetical protein [Nocardioides sp. YR527]SDK70901.1 hypothetical protein SAMN05428985_105392 [Nocardioides sp. YR527]